MRVRSVADQRVSGDLPLDPWPLEYPDGSRARDFAEGVADYLSLDGVIHGSGEIGRGLQFKPRLGFEQDPAFYSGIR